MSKDNFYLLHQSLYKIVKNWLENHPEYDGLANPEIECGCTKADLMPCGEPSPIFCCAGHKEGNEVVIGPKTSKKER